MAKLIFISIFVSFLVLNAFQERGLKKRGLETKGQFPIDPKLFKLGKISTLLCWLAAFLQAFGLNMRLIMIGRVPELFAAALFLGGFGILAAAYRDLGPANKTGLPSEETELKTSGLYSYSRNPLYLGLYMMTAGAVIYSGCVLVLMLGITSIGVHHRIVLAEEKFLQERFGEKYVSYKARTRRYL